MFTDILNEQGVLSTYIVLQRDWGCCILCKKCKNSFTGEIMFMRWYSPIRVYCRNPRVRTGPRLPVRWSDCPSQWWRDDGCSSLPYWQSCSVRDSAPARPHSPPLSLSPLFCLTAPRSLLTPTTVHNEWTFSCESNSRSSMFMWTMVTESVCKSVCRQYISLF